MHIVLYSVLLHACCVLGRGGCGVRRAIVVQQFQFVHFLIPIVMIDDTAGRSLCSQTPFKENNLILDRFHRSRIYVFSRGMPDVFVSLYAQTHET
jgi:hypothetical protein